MKLFISNDNDKSGFSNKNMKNDIHLTANMITGYF